MEQCIAFTGSHEQLAVGKHLGEICVIIIWRFLMSNVAGL